MELESNIELENLASEEEDLDIDTAPFQIHTYGADYTLEILAKKIDEKEIIIPPFQRLYVWTDKKASKLVESFLLGLPVPQIFLYRQEKTENLLVVDGQQRLRTIHYFMRGWLENERPFALRGVKQNWEGKTFMQLDEPDKRRFKNSVMRATVFQQTDPKDNSSVFQIFERLNTGGMALTMQEIRNCVTRGKINDFLAKLNAYSAWRSLLNKQSPDTRMKDVEMILRFLALYEEWQSYKKPMKDFISNFMEKNKNLNTPTQNKYEKIFQNAVGFISKEIGSSAFRLTAGTNIALFDALTVAIAKSDIRKIKDAKIKLEDLKKNPIFVEAVSSHTTDEEKVQSRIKIALQTFAK